MIPIYRALTGRIFIIAIGALVAVSLGPQGARAESDAYWSRLWNMRKVGAEAGWTAGGGKGTTIAIVDSGVDLTHPDLRDNITSGRDMIAGNDNPQDQFGHGTHVAGIAAAVANNGIGVAGIAPQAKIMPVRVLDDTGSGSISNVDAGIRWAADHGAQVINLSLGSEIRISGLSAPSPDSSLTSAVNYAWSKGAICVVAAGNDSLFRTDMSQVNAIIVTATTQDDVQASYANGVGLAQWGMAAPGGDSTDTKTDTAGMIFSTYWTKDGHAAYAYEMGTSMATPHVAGAAALLRGLGLSPQQTVDRLLATAKDLGASGNDLTYGYGRLDVAAAVAGISPHQPARSASPNAPAVMQAAGTSRVASGGTMPAYSGGTSAGAPRASLSPGSASAPASAPAASIVAQSGSAPKTTGRSAHPGRSMWPILLGGGVIAGSGAGVLVYARLRGRRAVA